MRVKHEGEEMWMRWGYVDTGNDIGIERDMWIHRDRQRHKEMNIDRKRQTETRRDTQRGTY